MAEKTAHPLSFKLFSESVTDRPIFQHIKQLPQEDYSHHVTIQLANFQQLSMTHVSIRPGESHPRHAHSTAHHAIYVLEGVGVASIENRDYPLTPGTFLIIPQHVVHHTTATGPESLNYVQMLVPVEPERKS